MLNFPAIGLQFANTESTPLAHSNSDGAMSRPIIVNFFESSYQGENFEKGVKEIHSYVKQNPVISSGLCNRDLLKES